MSAALRRKGVGMLRRMGIAALASVTLAATGLLWANRPAALPRGTRADLLVVHKSARRMLLYAHGSVVRSYVIALGRDPVGPKRRAGDHRTPEGRYIIDQHNPGSAFHRSLHVSYPSAADAARALAAGHSPGGEVMIHGMRNGVGWLGRMHLAADWTDGCIAVTDAEMDELYAAVPDGTPIEIRP
jgi:murein L,D-transpeptidase YafK